MKKYLLIGAAILLAVVMYLTAEKPKETVTEQPVEEIHLKITEPVMADEEGKAVLTGFTNVGAKISINFGEEIEADNNGKFEADFQLADKQKAEEVQVTSNFNDQTVTKKVQINIDPGIQAQLDDYEKQIADYQARLVDKKAYSQDVTYQMLLDSPNKYKGDLLAVEGTLMQVDKREDITMLVLNFDGNKDQLSLLQIDNDKLDAELKDDQTIVAYTQGAGLTEIGMSDGSKVNVPIFVMNMYDIK